MLFELDNSDNYYDVDLDYFNINKFDKIDKKTEYTMKKDINIDSGFYLGNLFSEEYKPYKNFKSKKIMSYSEQQKMLLRIQELDFIINDLNLYLDINPEDKRIFEIFKKCNIELNMLKKKYYEKYQVLELCYEDKNKYTWIDNPWPWDGGYYV